ncbi:hypothetical protein ASPFODRAFT_57116 [Aspergillus luchuensis CBS 106.47]|uniref:Bys1 family protein n=1 Tax=Aspergillus luchuensis (strain CBS 106.47) TaxID=1137211 RepID=A0A1M3TVH6_ASPLC|nr:hypothetical protein ASPFODRAFT_57116 [Aspergillus luchuensis CBS 106.47]
MKPTILLPLLLPLATTHPTPQDTTTITTSTITPGHAIILNTCAFPIYAWSVSSIVGPQITIPAAAPVTSSSSSNSNSTTQQYSNYTEPYHHDAQTGGVSIKLTTLRNGLYTGAPQTIFAYNFVEGQNQVWFDLSDVYGDPFKGRRRWRMFGSQVGDVERQADTGCERCLDEDSGRHCITVEMW